MLKLSADEAKDKFDEVLDLVKSERVMITEDDEVVAVVLSSDEYAQLEQIKAKLQDKS